MSNERRIEANRKNAQLSTGPRTADGKARVASNALKHGLTGKQVVLPNEKPADFDAFRVGLLKDLKPVGELEGALAESIAADLWRLRRVPMLEAAIYRRGHQEQIIHELEQVGYEMLRGKSIMDEEIVAMLKEERSKLDDPSMAVTMVLQRHPETFANLWRHEAVLSRSVLRTLHELQRLQAMRAGERVPAPAIVDVDVNIGQDEAANPEAILQNKPSSLEPVSAKVEPDATPIEDKRVQVSFFITKSQKAQLRELGYSDDDIAKMKPAEAHTILGVA